MKNWYLTREGGNCFHRGVKLTSNKKVLLTEEEAGIHNKHKEFLVKTEAPKDVAECAFVSDFKEVADIAPTNNDEEAKRERRKNKKEAIE